MNVMHICSICKGETYFTICLYITESKKITSLFCHPDTSSCLKGLSDMVKMALLD